MIQDNVSSLTRRDNAAALSYLVGQDKEGHWLVVEEHGHGGGFFTSKAAALSYVQAEVCGAQGCCRLASEVVDLSFGPAPLAARAA